MEYNLLKTIEPNLGLQMCPTRNPHLTPYPAVDYVNPGLGQAARLFSFYVPLYNNLSPFNIVKEQNNSSVEQEGGSKDQSADNEPVSFGSDRNIDPIEFNDRKRKLMGDGIQSSFMHPKIVTDTINLEPQSKVKRKTETVSLKSEKMKTGKGQNVKHKFQFD
jgi:hypothetical protein